MKLRAGDVKCERKNLMTKSECFCQMGLGTGGVGSHEGRLNSVAYHIESESQYPSTDVSGDL